jgi:hypothetical protein
MVTSMSMRTQKPCARNTKKKKQKADAEVARGLPQLKQWSGQREGRGEEAGDWRLVGLFRLGVTSGLQNG